MMTNLFSIFDPSTNIMSLSLNWLSTTFFIFFIPLNFWLTPNSIYTLYNLISKTLFKEFKILKNTTALNGNSLIFISLFFFIFFNNFLGLMPYIFTATTHMALTLTLSLTIWLSLMLFGWINNYTHMMAHLIPLGTPLILTWFMVIIETVSNLIRPLTLAIRLMTNMLTGHLLLTLMNSMNSKLSYTLVIMILITQILLLTLEMSVAIIQAYVFFILATLYSTEI
uniref:ATP synthase subunit a n=1 Tax=Oecetis caucula TaxID=2904905 RepID=A0A9E8LP41_9NEOP|nr:ATP synthase F0 subunit 6 [Oecetis caucula]UZZ44212.1 ATP synthase F0 subunit 6 [Oecetis caucula]